MSKKDSKVRYAIKINVKSAKAVREACRHKPLSYDEMETLANRVAEVVNHEPEGYYDPL